MPTAAPLPPPTNARRLTRDDIIRLGQSSKPWDFLPIGLAAARAAPTDPAVRFLLAANFARLALRTPATEQLDILAELTDHARDPQQAALAAAIAQLPGDRLPAQLPLDTCRFNLELLATRGLDLWPEHERWTIAQAGCEWFRAADGNLLRRRGETWLGLGDHRSAAVRFATTHINAAAPSAAYFIEGVDPPWIALEVAKATPPTRAGFRPMLCLIQADAQEFLDGLAHADLSPLLRDPRVYCFVGRHASGALAEHLRARAGCGITGPYIPIHSTRRRADPSIESVLINAQAAQAEELAALAERVAARAAERDRTWWLRRYTHALLPHSCIPLRVLIPTTRHSTYLQHSSRDLADAFAAAGHHVKLLIEDDDHAQFASVGYLRALSEFDADLVILINCMRPHLGPWFPPVPYICWIQDAMPHQFSEQAAAQRGPLDFLVGHLHAELFTRFGFTRERTLTIPVVTSETKFHPAPVEPSLRRRFECDIAFVSHHSETPEQMHLRLLSEAGPDRSAIRTLERLYPEVDRIARDPLGGDQQTRLEQAVRTAIESECGRADDKVVTSFTRQYALPLAERILRHQTLAWAAEVAERRAWRLRIYGKGWEQHERFAPYAAGQVEHGEELRACYQCAAVHLHISVTALIHQRIMECALSGGLPVCRLTSSALDTVINAARRDVWLNAKPAHHNAADNLYGFNVADSADLLRLTALQQRLGLPHAHIYWQPAVDLEKARENVLPPERRPDWVLADLSETTFSTPADLESRIARALESPDWRRGISQTIANRVRHRLTHSAFARQVLQLVQTELTNR